MRGVPSASVEATRTASRPWQASTRHSVFEEARDPSHLRRTATIPRSATRSVANAAPTIRSNWGADYIVAKNQKKLTRARQMSGTCKTNQLRKQRVGSTEFKREPACAMKTTRSFHITGEGCVHGTSVSCVTTANYSTVGSLRRSTLRVELLFRENHTETLRNRPQVAAPETHEICVTAKMC